MDNEELVRCVHQLVAKFVAPQNKAQYAKYFGLIMHLISTNAKQALDRDESQVIARIRKTGTPPSPQIKSPFRPTRERAREANLLPPAWTCSEPAEGLWRCSAAGSVPQQAQRVVFAEQQLGHPLPARPAQGRLQRRTRPGRRHRRWRVRHSLLRCTLSPALCALRRLWSPRLMSMHALRHKGCPTGRRWPHEAHRDARMEEAPRRRHKREPLRRRPSPPSSRRLPPPRRNRSTSTRPPCRRSRPSTPHRATPRPATGRSDLRPRSLPLPTSRPRRSRLLLAHTDARCSPIIKKK
jgi:hypothetical protein